MAIGVIQSQTPSVQYQYFPTEYFTGADVSVYFGDTFVDELYSLEFLLQEPVLPLRGYASYTAHRFVRGARRIQGTFAINFKRAGYLYEILDHLGRLSGTTAGAVPYVSRLLNQSEDAASIPTWVAQANETINQLLDRTHARQVKSRTPEQWYLPLKRGDGAWSVILGTNRAAADEESRKLPSLRAALDFLEARGFISHEDTSRLMMSSVIYGDEFEAIIRRWQAQQGLPVTGVIDQATAETLTVIEYEGGDPGLDAGSRLAGLESQIWQSGRYGDPDNRYRTHFYGGRVEANDYTGYLAPQGFDIYIVYGALDKTAAASGAVGTTAAYPTTVRALYGVQLTGCQQALSADGRQVLEVYTFEARDLDFNSALTKAGAQ